MTPLRILQISTTEASGGAERIALGLHRGLRALGHDASLAVGQSTGTEPGVVLLDNAAARGLAGAVEEVSLRLAARLPRSASLLARGAGLLLQPGRLASALRGEEDFDMPATAAVLDLAGGPPDVVVCHNLHGGYFDLRALERIGAAAPTVLVLHDMWAFTGHCAYSLGCERWRAGCGHCPDLSLYPPILRDATDRNLRRKADIYGRARFHVAAPSRWLLDKARESVLGAGAVDFTVIPNGVDLTLFHPGDRAAARARLGLAPERKVLLYVANAATTNPYKDFVTARGAVQAVARELGDAVVALVVGGGEGPVQEAPGTRFVPFVSDRRVLADYYRAADLFLHAAVEDNFPNTVLESLACGTPVVATAVGGIPEQVRDGETGALVAARSPEEMAAAAVALLRDPERLARMRTLAAEDAAARFDSERHVRAYAGWLEQLAAQPLPRG